MRTKEGKWGYIDKTGQFVIPAAFGDVSAFSDGLAMVVVGVKRLMGYIDKSGTFIVPAQYGTYSPRDSNFSEGLACVEANGRWGFINRQGKTVIDAQFAGPSSFHDGLAVAQVGEKSSTRWGYIDKTGTFAIAARFSLAWPFSEGLARVRDNAVVGVGNAEMTFIDRTGTMVFTVPGGGWAGEFSEGLVNVQTGDRLGREAWGYVDRNGKWAIEPRFQKAEPFHNGLAQVLVGYKFAYIDKTGRYVWGPDSGNEALAAKLRTQISAEDRRKNEEEFLRLAKLIGPLNPPLTEQQMQPGEVPAETLQKLAEAGSDPARQLLERLLSYTAKPSDLFPEMAESHQREVRERATRALIAIGDPFVLPTLRRWLSDALKAEEVPDIFSQNSVRCALEGLRQFHDETSLAEMEKLLRHPGLEPSTRDMALLAIAGMEVLQTKTTLLDALKDERFEEQTRCKAAAALVRMGEIAGRQFLLENYDLYLAGLRKPPGAVARLVRNSNSWAIPNSSRASEPKRMPSRRASRRITSIHCSMSWSSARCPSNS